MELVKHETCQQYVARRLSEGWGIVWQKGHHLILSSPDGKILRPVDLRNDVETLRPNAAGDDEEIAEVVGDGVGTHYTTVDEETPDEDTTLVKTDTASWERDLYNIQNHSAGYGTINHIHVYARFKTVDPGGFRIYIKAGVGSNPPDVLSYESISGVDTSWDNFSWQWDINPKTTSAFTWDEIDNLQAGIGLFGNGTYAYCTQVYVEVDYTPITPKTSSDTGSGVDAKASGNPLATFPVRSETGGGVDGHKAVAPQSAGETGSGVDALTALLGILARSETGLGTDAKLSLLAALVKADSGSGVEHILDRALVLISESGSGLDVSHLVKTLLLTETGTGAENSYLHILEGVKDSHETGSGVDASTLAALHQRSDAGSGVDEVIARALYAREYPTGALDLAKVITAAITGAETGTGAEASLRAVFFKRDETGSGVDTSTLAALFTGEDSGAGAEAITLLAAMVAQDTGVGVEAVLSYLRTLVDSGQGEEVVNIIGAVGRAMKLITYLRAYSDLAVYTKPYSDLRVYTHEVKK